MFTFLPNVVPAQEPLTTASPAQLQDEAYTKKIREYTTEPFFLTELVDHLPAAELANTPAVVDVPVGRGRIVLFANNPMWHQETHGSFMLLLNAALHRSTLRAPGPRPQTPRGRIRF